MIEQELFEHLKNEVTEVEGRVYPNLMPQKCVKPALVYTVVSSLEESSMSGWCEGEVGGSSEKIRFQVDVYHTHYGLKKVIKNSVKRALKSFSTPVKNITNRDLYEEEVKLYRELIEFNI